MGRPISPNTVAKLREQVAVEREAKNKYKSQVTAQAKLLTAANKRADAAERKLAKLAPDVSKSARG